MWFSLALIALASQATLGRYLFYDVRLSGNGAQSCASCHRQELAFTDGKARALGATGQLHPRSAMSLVNLSRAALLTWNNPHRQSLEEQMLTPMLGEQPVELGMNTAAALQAIAADPVYRRLFPLAFPLESDRITLPHITRAIAAFERTIVSNRSPYDRYHSGGDNAAVSLSARRGETLFFSEPLSCFRCHGGASFSDSGELKDNGLLREGGKFKAPTLRNIAVTAPYMHDGRLQTLEAVIDHYAKGGSHSPYQDELIHGFPLSASARGDLIEFLNTLTDQELLHDARFSNPWLKHQ